MKKKQVKAFIEKIELYPEKREDEGQASLEEISERAEAHKPKERVTYQMIKYYIEEKYGFKVYTAYIAEAKREWDYQCTMHQMRWRN